MRKIRIFQKDAYISIDYPNRSIAIYKRQPGPNLIPGLPDIVVEERSFAQSDALRDEINAFVSAVANGTPPVVSGEDGKRALDVAMQISSRLWHEVSG